MSWQNAQGNRFSSEANGISADSWPKKFNHFNSYLLIVAGIRFIIMDLELMNLGSNLSL